MSTRQEGETLNPFEIEGNWYKGNLHTHTDESDGDISPQKTVEGYEKNNYDFLTVTDHDKVTKVQGYSRKNFLVLPGIEIGVDTSSVGTRYHLVGINTEEGLEVSPAFGAQLRVQEGINFLKKKGSEVILAHPYWSGLTMEELFSLEGNIGVEVYNSTCLRARAKGFSSIFWDALLAKGKLNWGFAVDDTHLHHLDAYKGWVMVKAPLLNKQSIVHSIKNGLFYSSCGPQIKGVNCNGKKVYARTSPVKLISFMCDHAKGMSVWNYGEKELFEAEFKLKGTEKYLRVECMDQNGQSAWTNPLFLKH